MASQPGRRGRKLTPEDVRYMHSFIKRYTEEERFFSKVDKSGGPDACWPWTGSKHPTGYGLFGVPQPDGRSFGKRAHRVAWRLAGNELPEWPMVIDHMCRNRGCQNVRHMRVVPQRINTIENSESYWAKNYAKTECKYGHPLSGDNLLVAWVTDHKAKKRGDFKKRATRVCLTCKARRTAEYMAKYYAAKAAKTVC